MVGRRLNALQHMRYSLRTLLMAVSVGPPFIAFVWLSWWMILLVLLALAMLLLWVAVSYALARLCGIIVGSVMGS